MLCILTDVDPNDYVWIDTNHSCEVCSHTWSAVVRRVVFVAEDVITLIRLKIKKNDNYNRSFQNKSSILMRPRQSVKTQNYPLWNMFLRLLCENNLLGWCNKAIEELNLHPEDMQS